MSFNVEENSACVLVAARVRSRRVLHCEEHSPRVKDASSAHRRGEGRGKEGGFSTDMPYRLVLCKMKVENEHARKEGLPPIW